MSKGGSTSVACNSASKTSYPLLPYIFWTLWTWGFTKKHAKHTIPIQKILSKLRFSDRFLGVFWWFLRSYIAKTAIFKIWVFWVISMYSVTLFVIDIQNIRCLEPFLSLYGHFEIRRILGINWQYIAETLSYWFFSGRRTNPAPRAQEGNHYPERRSTGAGAIRVLFQNCGSEESHDIDVGEALGAKKNNTDPRIDERAVKL